MLITDEFFLCFIICTFGLRVGPCLLRFFIITPPLPSTAHSSILHTVGTQQIFTGGGEDRRKRDGVTISNTVGRRSFSNPSLRLEGFLRLQPKCLFRQSCLCDGFCCYLWFLSYAGHICHQSPSVSPPNKVKPSFLLSPHPSFLPPSLILSIDMLKLMPGQEHTAGNLWVLRVTVRVLSLMGRWTHERIVTNRAVKAPTVASPEA